MTRKVKASNVRGRRDLGLECLVSGSKYSIRSQVGQSSEQNISRNVQPRVRRCENVLLPSPFSDGQAQEEKDADGEEQDVQAPGSVIRQWFRWRTSSHSGSDCAVV